MDDATERSLLEAARLFRKARRRIAFTGAGISVESGIPPFRGEGGIWGRHDPSLLELSRFMADPESSWRAIREIFYEKTAGALPNAAHRVLADWERDGLLELVVTQNIDGLHRGAGSRRVVEYHGTLRSLTCQACGARYRADRAAIDAGLLEELPPRCSAHREGGAAEGGPPSDGASAAAPRAAPGSRLFAEGPAGRPCGGLLRPDFVFFGETIPPEAHARAFEAAEAADFCLVVGSTGLVYPAALVPITVARKGGAVVEVDPGSTEFGDEVARVRIRLGAVEGLTRLDALVRG